MPLLSGVDVCREARKAVSGKLHFLVMVTVRDGAQDIVDGLDAGANDYITKPFDNAELLARVRVGSQMVELQQSLATRVRELETAMAHIKQLKGLLPICGYCKKIRADENYWQEVEGYIIGHADVQFSHGVCPDCFEVHMRPQLRKVGLSEAEIVKMTPRTNPPRP
jgi:YesN/AraC family two-component response regulator